MSDGTKAAAAKVAAAKIVSENKKQAGELKACLLEDTDAKCKALKTKTDAAHTTAASAEKKAKGDALTVATAKTAQVEGWVTNVDASLKNKWANDDSQAQFELWMKESFKMAATKTAADALKTTIDSDVTTAEAKTKSTGVTLAAAKPSAKDAAQTASTDAIAKEAELKAW